MNREEAFKIAHERESRPIVRGDEVEVTFQRHHALRGTVIDSPSASGDCWRIQNSAGRLYYVQTFEFLVRIPDALWLEARGILMSEVGH